MSFTSVMAAEHRNGMSDVCECTVSSSRARAVVTLCGSHALCVALAWIVVRCLSTLRLSSARERADDDRSTGATVAVCWSECQL